MTKKEITDIAKSYLESSKNNAKSIRIKYPQSFQAIEEYDQSKVSTFLSDAMILKDIDFYGECHCTSSDFIKNNVQYYLLSTKQLISYFKYRSNLKDGVVEERNNYYTFLLIYLTEVVNGLYGSSLYKKWNILDEVLIAYTNLDDKYLSAIKDSFEIVYLQNIDNQKVLELSNNTSLELFSSSSMFDKEIDAFSIISHLSYIDREKNYKDKEKYVLQQCFSYLVDEIEKMHFDVFDFLYLPELMKVKRRIEDVKPYHCVRALYQPTLNATLLNYTSFKEEVIKYGILTTRELYLEEWQKVSVKKFMSLTINSIRHHCTGTRLRNAKLGKIDKVNPTIAKIKRDEYQSAQLLIDKLVGQWLDKNIYYKMFYNSPLEELKFIINNKDIVGE